MTRHIPLTLLLTTVLVPLAGAQTNPWYVGASQAVQHESNLYRVDDDIALGEGFSRSDTISITSLVAGLDQPIGRQRLYGSAAVRANRYSNNGYLDGTSYSLSGGLDWSTIERLSGEIAASATRSQRRFNVDTGPDVAETRKNDESVEQIDATVRVGVVTRMTLEASVGQRRLGFSASEFANSEYTQNRASLGLRYRPGIATFGAALRSADSDYRAGDERVRRTSVDLTLYWPATADSSLYARLSPTRVRYDTFTERNYSGVTGSLKWDWRATGKVRLLTLLVHDIGQDSSFENFGSGSNPLVGTSNTSRTTTELRTSADYAASAKIALTAALGLRQRSLDRNVTATGQTLDVGSGRDTTTNVSLGLRWTPLRSVQVGTDLTHEQRSASGNLTQRYSANTLSVFGQFTLQ